jgi:hypothetical protein
MDALDLICLTPKGFAEFCSTATAHTEPDAGNKNVICGAFSLPKYEKPKRFGMCLILIQNVLVVKKKWI